MAILAALASIDALIKMRPKDGFYYALKGEILLDAWKSPAAVEAYEMALEKHPNEFLLQAEIGRAYLALNPEDGNKKALNILEKARTQERSTTLMHNLAKAYARLGKPGMAAVTAAERYYALFGR